MKPPVRLEPGRAPRLLDLNNPPAPVTANPVPPVRFVRSVRFSAEALEGDHERRRRLREEGAWPQSVPLHLPVLDQPPSFEFERPTYRGPLMPVGPRDPGPLLIDHGLDPARFAQAQPRHILGHPRLTPFLVDELPGLHGSLDDTWGHVLKRAICSGLTWEPMSARATATSPCPAL